MEKKCTETAPLSYKSNIQNKKEIHVFISHFFFSRSSPLKWNSGNKTGILSSCRSFSHLTRLSSSRTLCTSLPIAIPFLLQSFLHLDLPATERPLVSLVSRCLRSRNLTRWEFRNVSNLDSKLKSSLNKSITRFNASVQLITSAATTQILRNVFLGLELYSWLV